MNELTVHFQTKNEIISPDFLSKLENVAEEYGVSIDPQTRQTIQEAIRNKQRKVTEFLRQADAIAEEIGPIQSDSAEDIRALRDNR